MPVPNDYLECKVKPSVPVEEGNSTLRFIQQLNPLDRQLMVLYLEDLDAAAISEITGISAGNVATRIHRIKNLLSRRFGAGGRHA